jgi:hypothetical protein
MMGRTTCEEIPQNLALVTSSQDRCEEIPQNLALVTSSQDHLNDWQNRHEQHLLNSEDPVDPMSVSLFSTSNFDTSTAFMLSLRNSGLPSSFLFSPDKPTPLLSPRTSLDTARTVDRIDLGGESSVGTARSGNEADDAPSPLVWTSSQRASGGGGGGGARGGEEGSEFVATQSKVPTPGQVKSRLMPDMSDSM